MFFCVTLCIIIISSTCEAVSFCQLWFISSSALPNDQYPLPKIKPYTVYCIYEYMYVGTLFVDAEWLLWLETLLWSFRCDKPLSCGWMDEHGHRQPCQRDAHSFETAKVNVCSMLFSSLRSCQPKSASPTGHFYHLPKLPTGDKLLS